MSRISLSFISLLILLVYAHLESTGSYLKIPDRSEELVPKDLLNGRAISITDGDTFKLLLNDSSNIKIRVASIDCPERKQAFSKRAKQFTSEAIYGKSVRVEVKSQDRYGRYVADVYYGKKNLAKELLKNGLAWHYLKYSDDPNLDKLEKRARAKRKGLWSDKDPIAPWEWRRGKKASK